MKAVGIVVEYNPFHNGHVYHIQKTKEFAPNSIIIAVMSGDFVQRGEPSIIDKHLKSKIAIKNGIDMVVELPSFYSCQSAEIFARGAVGMLEELKCGEIVFGSEKENLEYLFSLANMTEDENFKMKLRGALKNGNSYINAYKIASDGRYDLDSNDILALEYIKSIKFWESDILPRAIKREKATYYDENSYDNITSGFNLRKLLKERRSINHLIPEKSKEIFLKAINDSEIRFLEEFYPLIRYKIIDQRKNLAVIQDMEVGLDKRFYKCATKNNCFSSFMKEIMSKRLTIGRIQRVLIHILLGLTTEITEKVKKEIPFIKILDYNERGQKYLNYLKKYENKKIFATFKNITKRFDESTMSLINFNEKSSTIYNMVNNRG